MRRKIYLMGMPNKPSIGNEIVKLKKNYKSYPDHLHIIHKAFDLSTAKHAGDSLGFQMDRQVPS